MSLGNSLFLLSILLICLILYAPIRLQFTAEHRDEWNASATIHYLWLHHEMPISIQTIVQKTEMIMQKRDSENLQERSVQIYWKSVFDFLRKAMQCITKRLHLEQLCAHCYIGWERADITAYSYGLFWSLMSLLPERWLQNSDIIYVPDFQYERKDISVQGIISCRAGQVMAILISLVRLSVHMMLEQKRKEQM